MRAIAPEDFRKVLEVAREQMYAALAVSASSSASGPLLSMDDYRKGLKTYHEISEMRKEEAKSRGEREGRAVRHLRQAIMPEIIELIQRQRLNVLSVGTRFAKGGGGKEQRGKHIFVRLSANRKSFYYGDWSPGDVTPTTDQLPHKLPVAEVKDLLTGASYPHARDSNRRGVGGGRDRGESRAFSLVRETGDPLDLVAPDEKTFDLWCDGINTLLMRDMKSARATEDLEMFLSMEVKIRLLDVEGINIPDQPPKVPPLPPDFDFCQEV